MKYIGVKLIEAEPMDEHTAYNKNILKTKNPNGSKNGYKVVYEDGYVSWSPDYVFDKAYRPITNMTYGLAIEAMRMGKCIARSGWNGSNMFIYYQKTTVVNEDIIPYMTSVPDESKQLLKDKNLKLSFINGMIIVDSKGNANSWVASSSDTFAEDWYIV